MNQSDVLGSWRIVRIQPNSESDLSMRRFIHFFPDGLHVWEHPFTDGKIPRIWKFNYRITAGGVYIIPENQLNGWEVPIEIDDNLLVFRDGNGKKIWWLERISAAERPSYLTYYCDKN